MRTSAIVAIVMGSACGRLAFDDRAGSDDAAATHDTAFASTYAATVLADLPIAYYRFDELAGAIAKDSSPSGFDGAYGATVQLGIAGLLADDPSTAIAIAGAEPPASSNVAIARRATLEPAEISMEAWVRTESVAPQPILSYGESYQLYLGFAGADTFEVQIGAMPRLVSNVSPTIDGRYHVVGTYDSVDIELYVNGVLATTIPAPGAMTYSGSDLLWIGGDNTSTYAPFVGTIDEVAIYDFALSANRVAAHYTAGQ